MQTKTLTNGSTIRYYEDIEEFPIDRKPAWVKYLTLAGGLDMTIDAQMARIGVIMDAVEKGENVDANVLLMNLYTSLNAINQLALSPDSFAVGVLIADVDEKATRDMSENGLITLLKRLQITQREVDEILSDVKKNSLPAATSISLGML